ncbi:MAG TPA: peptidylprolyl isomerase [Vicinamibacterales bacterium]
MHFLQRSTSGGRRLRRAAPAALLLAAALVTGAHVSAEVIEQVLVKVNGDIFTKSELERRQVMALRARGFQPSDDEELKKALEEVTPRVIVEAVDEMLLVQRGRELGYRMTDDDFNRIVENIRKENKLESEEAFQQALKQEGLTMAELRQSLERQMLIARVQQAEVNSKIAISEEEARKYHAEHLSEFTKPGQVTLREILITVPRDERGINVGAEEEARAKAEAARKRVLDGEAFEQVAADVSMSASRANGGLVGPLNPDDLSPVFQELLSKMKPGDVSDVLRVSNGFQIIKLESQTPAQVLTAEQARDRIADAIFRQKREGELQKYLQKLRSQAIIEWKNPEIRKAWESQVNASAAPSPDTAPPSS